MNLRGSGFVVAWKGDEFNGRINSCRSERDKLKGERVCSGMERDKFKGRINSCRSDGDKFKGNNS